MKKYIIIGFCCLLLAGGASFWRLIAPDYIASKITSEFENRGLKTPEFGNRPSLSLFPPTLLLSEISWEIPEAVSLRISSASVELDLAPLFHGDIDINEIVFDYPEISLKNINNMNQIPEISRPDGAPANYLIRRLIIQNGRLAISGKNDETILKDIKLLAENIQPRKDMEIKCDFTIEKSAQEKPVQPVGNLAINSILQYYPPNLTFRKASATFTSLENSFHLAPLQLQLSGSINVKNGTFRLSEAMLGIPQGKLMLNGEGKLNPREFSGHATLDLDLKKLADNQDFTPESAKFSSPISLKPESIAFSDMEMSAGRARGSGNLLIAKKEADDSPIISGKFKTGSIDLNWPSEKKAATAIPPVQPSGKAAQAAIGETTHPAYPSVNFQIQIEGITCNKFSIGDFSVSIFGKNGHYKTENSGFTWCDGKVSYVAALNLNAGEYLLNTEASGINFGKASSQLGLDGFENGVASVKLNLRAKGRNLKNISDTLSGNGLLEVKNTKLTLLENIVDTLTFFNRKLIDYSGTTLNAPISINNGKLMLTPIAITSSNLSAEGKALVDIPAETLDSRLDFKIGPLSIPITFHGPLGDISIGVDMGGREN